MVKLIAVSSCQIMLQSLSFASFWKRSLRSVQKNLVWISAMMERALAAIHVPTSFSYILLAGNTLRSKLATLMGLHFLRTLTPTRSIMIRNDGTCHIRVVGYVNQPTFPLPESRSCVSHYLSWKYHVSALFQLCSCLSFVSPGDAP